MSQLSRKETEELLDLMQTAFWASEHSHRPVTDPARMASVYEALRTYFTQLHPKLDSTEP